MKSGVKPLVLLLAILGVEDLVMVPFMVAANHSHAGSPPMPAIVLSGAVGLATLAAIPGLMQGRRWAFLVAIACRAVDMVQSFLGTVAGPAVGFKIVGVFAMVLAVAAVVMLVRLSPRRSLRRAASGA